MPLRKKPTRAAVNRRRGLAFSELVGRVHDQHERVTVTVHGRPSAVLIAPEDLEALEETLAIMRDAATMNRLAESDAELARGEYVSAEELAETMRRRRAS